MDARWSGEAKYQALLGVAQAANSCRDLSSVLEVVAGALQELVFDLIAYAVGNALPSRPRSCQKTDGASSTTAPRANRVPIPRACMR